MGSPGVWVAPSKGPRLTLGRNLPRPEDSKAFEIMLICSETRPEADIAVAPPAGSLEKEFETVRLAVTSNITIRLSIFNTAHFVLLHNSEVYGREFRRFL